MSRSANTQLTGLLVSDGDQHFSQLHSFDNDCEFQITSRFVTLAGSTLSDVLKNWSSHGMDQGGRHQSVGVLADGNHRLHALQANLNTTKQHAVLIIDELTLLLHVAD